MAILIGHACSNENTEITGGKAGDQTRREVRINTFFDGQTWQTLARMTTSGMTLARPDTLAGTKQ